MNDPDVKLTKLLYEHYVSTGQADSASEQIPVEHNPARLRYFRSLARRHFPNRLSAKILEIGCGYGTFLAAMKLEGYRNVSGVDLSPEQIALAHRLGVTEANFGTLQSATRESDGGYDTIVCHDILEHFSLADLVDGLSGIGSKLAPDGKLVLHVPNAEGLLSMAIRYGDITHQRAFTRSSLRQVLRASGFTEVSFFEEPPFIHGPASFIRFVLWQILMAPVRLAWICETGTGGQILSQNILAVAGGFQRNKLKL